MTRAKPRRCGCGAKTFLVGGVDQFCEGTLELVHLCPKARKGR